MPPKALLLWTEAQEEEALLNGSFYEEGACYFWKAGRENTKFVRNSLRQAFQERSLKKTETRIS